MPRKQTVQRARAARREGKAPTTQAGEFVREEMEKMDDGGRRAPRSRKQAIAIGLAQARRSGVDIPERGAKKTGARKAGARKTSRRKAGGTTTGKAAGGRKAAASSSRKSASRKSAKRATGRKTTRKASSRKRTSAKRASR
jgi:hypothetical protein